MTDSGYRGERDRIRKGFEQIVRRNLIASEEAVSESLQKKEENLEVKERESLLCPGRKFSNTTCDKVASRKCT